MPRAPKARTETPPFWCAKRASPSNCFACAPPYEVYETDDGVVRLRFDQTELRATAFAKDGGVRQQAIE